MTASRASVGLRRRKSNWRSHGESAGMTTSTWVGRERSWLSEQVVSGLMRISDCVVIAMAAGLAYLHGPVSMSWSAAPLLLIIAVLLDRKSTRLNSSH